MKKIKNIIIMLIVFALCMAGVNFANATDETNTTNGGTANILYSSHLRNLGWEEDYSKKDGETSGTVGENRAIEAIQIKLGDKMPQGATLKYQVHVTDIGWMDWVNEGDMAGTTGKAKNVEGIRIKLENAEDYSIEYLAHVQDIGWQEWAIDGEMAGTTGKNKKIEAIQIRIIPKTIRAKIVVNDITEPIYENSVKITGWAMVNTQNTKLETYIDNTKVENNVTYYENNKITEIGYGGIENTPKPAFDMNVDLSKISDGEKTLTIKLVSNTGEELATETKKINIQKEAIHLSYTAHVEEIGWQNSVYSPNTAGTEKKNLQMEAIKINLLGNVPENASIKYQTHVEEIGWQDWVSNGETAGTQKQNKRIEAIRIKLENMEDYSVEYRAHVEEIGWQEWAIDGEMAGTTGEALQVEAIQINIIPKQIRAKVNIDTNLENTTIDENTYTITGWAMANAENTTLNAYIDDQKIESTINYYEREDIKEIGYGGIENTPKPGFDMQLKLNNVTDGKHTLKLQLVDKTGKEIASAKKEINIDKSTIGVKYQSHVTNVGWEDWVRGPIQSNGGGNRLEALNIKLVGNLPEGAKITYQAHVSGIGWMDWVSDGETAGTTGQNRKIEAVRIKLENMEDYSIEYNAFVQGIGWQGWAYDGEIAGTTKQDKKIETIRIQIINKITGVRARMYVDEPIMDGVSTVKVTQKTTTIRGWAMTNVDGAHIRIEVDGKGAGSEVTREERQDVLDRIKGYGGEEKNPEPGFRATINFEEYSVGNHTISVKVLGPDNTLLCSIDKTLNVQPDFVFETGTYGLSGLGVQSHPQGTALPYYKIGKGPNVMFATFAIHGWEDSWGGDGSVLIKIAEDFKNMLVQNKPSDINNNWTIYIFNGVNRDGVYLGSTQDGPGRTTLYSMAPGNKGIDINRNWQTGAGYTRHTDNRNYNGTAPYQAYEANYLRQFLLDHKSTSGQTVLVDLHGWLNETIGDNGLGQHYRSQYGMSHHIKSYGDGYLVNWARQNLGANGIAARSTLVELPQVSSQAEADARGYSAKYYNATLNMLRAIK